MTKIKLIIFGQTITALIYASVYLFKSFVCWDLTNPFNWILNLGSYNNELRFFILNGFIYYYVILYIIINENKKQIINFLTFK